MQSKRYLTLLAVTLIIMLGTKTSSTHAQSSQDEQIPSDLSLDLDLAQKNPAPAQKQIVQSQTPQAKIVTDQGEQAVLPISEEVPEEIKLQSVKDTIDPVQSTSEQVVDKTVEETANPSETPSNDNNQSAPSNNPASSPTDNMIPGTNIMEPDDNTAPQLPTTSATPGGEQSNPIPPENAPSSSTSDTAPPASNDSSGTSSDNSSNQSSGSDNNNGSDNSGGENSSVQGVSTSWWQLLLNRIFKK